MAPAAAWAGLTVAGTLLHPGSRPTDAPAQVLGTLQAAPFTATLAAVLLLASAAPLAVWTATVHQRLQALGVRVAGPTIGLVGGILAAAALAISGLAAWTAASVAPAGSAGVVHAFNLASFGAGGPLFAVTFALLIAGVAVPALILRLVPRTLSIAGLVVAGVGVAGLLVLLVPVLGPVLPIARFGGLLWLVAISVLLPRTRAEARERARPRAQPRH
ncbi:DUF4386 domain-containing protein [Bounagaea algeriensis]